MRWAMLGGLVVTLLLARFSMRQVVDIEWGADPAALAGMEHAAELARIQAHLSRAARAIRTSAPDHFTAEQREARRTTLAWLEQYRANVAFPHNHVLPGERTPVFVDPHGTPCAVGYLMLRSGEADLVEEIVGADNLVRVPELWDDARVQRWLDSRGITLEEAAMIQPAYGPHPIPIRESSGYAEGTLGMSLATAAVSTYAAVVGSDEGAPLVDALLFGTAIGHTYLLMETREGEPDGLAWATSLNVVGLLVSVVVEGARVVGRGQAPEASAASAVVPHVAQGRFGTEVGLSLRH